MTSKPEQFVNAAIKGDTKTVAALLTDGIDVNTRDSRGLPTNRTALMHAAENGHIKIVDLLIKAGAKINAIDKGFPIDCPGGNTALILAIQKGHIPIANRLLDAGASVKTKGGGTSVINAAAYLGDVGLVKRLLELGADPMQRDGSGFIPIASAVSKGNLDVIRLLLELGINPNSQSPGGTPVLLDAVCDGNVELCKLLVNGGADPNLGGSSNFTPLMMACRCAQEKAVEYLLSLRVKVNECDESGRTALDIVEIMQQPPDLAPEVIKRRIEMGLSMGSPPKRLKVIAALLRKSGATTRVSEQT